MLEKPITLCQHSSKRPRRKRQPLSGGEGPLAAPPFLGTGCRLGAQTLNKEPWACDCKRDILSLENPQGGEEKGENEVK